MATPKSGTASDGFSAGERTAMKERAAGPRAEGRKGTKRVVALVGKAVS